MDRRVVWERRADEDRARDPLRREPRQLQLVLSPGRDACHHRALGAGRVHHRQTVARELDGLVAPWIATSIGAAAAEPIHDEHAEVTRQVGDLHLPVARVHDRPGRQQEDRLLPLAIDLIEQTLSLPLDESFRVGVAGAALLRCTTRCISAERR
jgi:hypothetical protein